MKRAIVCTVFYLLCLSTANTATGETLEPPIKVISYNVYFDDNTGKQRYPQIISLLKQGNFNVIALQECTDEFIQLISKDEELSKLSISKGNSKHGYSNIILTSLPVIKSGDYQIPSNMGRSAPYIELEQSSLIFINVHLESGDSQQSKRFEQIQTLHAYITTKPDVVILGDFNFGDGSNEEELLSDFFDMGDKDNQVTYDVNNNRLAKDTKDWLEKSRRLDRIMIKCKQCQASEFSVLNVSYSDHYPIKMHIKTGI